MAIAVGKIKPEWAALSIELVVGTIMFAHGLPKMMDTAGFASRELGGIPMFLAYLVVAAELGGGLLLLLGLLVRLGAIGHIAVMAVAVGQVHWGTGLTGQGGFEYPLALLAASIALLILGADPLSIDHNAGRFIYRSREAAFRRESIDIASPTVKAAGALLILAGIALPLARNQLGVPEGTGPLVMMIIAGLVSIASGALLAAGKPYAYLPAFVVARLYLAAGVLLLFWIKFTLRGIIVILLSLALLAALRSARRGTN